MSKQNYVYVYAIADRPVYVGIGNNAKNPDYGRARNLRGHSSVPTRLHAELEIRIVARNLSRLSARRIEALLISFGLGYGDLFNRHVPHRGSSDQRLHQFVLGPMRCVRDRRKPDPRQAEYLDLIKICPGQEEECAFELGYYPAVAHYMTKEQFLAERERYFDDREAEDYMNSFEAETGILWSERTKADVRRYEASRAAYYAELSHQNGKLLQRSFKEQQ